VIGHVVEALDIRLPDDQDEIRVRWAHRPALGNPKVNRAGFSGGPAELAHARETFARWISQPQATEAIDEVAVLAQKAVVAVLCFEADQTRCHRDVVLAEVAGRSVSALVWFRIAF
jgi:uncharacterized protein (DUF488 family)